MAQVRAKQRGFTLIELLMYVTIIGALLVGLSFFVALSSEARIKNQSILEVEEQGTLLMERLTHAIRNADSVMLPAVGAQANSLTLAMPEPAANPTVFSLDDGVLQIKEGASGAIPLSNTRVVVGNLVFKNVSRSATTGAVQVSFTLSRQGSENRQEYAYQKVFVTTATVL